jgi:hypothetical protein
MAVATGAPFGFLTSKGDRVESLRLRHPSCPKRPPDLDLAALTAYPHASTEARKWLNLAKMAEMSHIGSCNFSAGLAFK